jgi:hypothetical protein
MGLPEASNRGTGPSRSGFFAFFGGTTAGTGGGGSLGVAYLVISYAAGTDSRGTHNLTHS